MSSETIKNALDAVVISGGLGATISYWVGSIINPILTGFVLLGTLIWTYYRIQDLRDKRENRKTNKDDS